MKYLLSVWILFILLGCGLKSSACTAFCLKTSGGIYLAKNLDWKIDSGYLFLNEKGEEKFLLNAGGLRWKSKYRSITFNQFGKEFPLGGMNEPGLVIEELNASPVKLITDSTKQRINEFQLVQYLLDNCKSVDETIRQLEKLQCEPLFQPLHYIIADRMGNVIVTESNGAGFTVYLCDKTGFPVLSNNNYSESLKYLSNFQGFGGDLPVKNNKGSNERFVSAADLLLNYNYQAPVAYSFQVLDTVKQTDTRWSLVYDIKSLSIYFRFHSCKTVKVFDFMALKDLEFISGLGGNLSDCNFLGNGQLRIISTDENIGLIQNVVARLTAETGVAVDAKLLYELTVIGNHNLNLLKRP